MVSAHLIKIADAALAVDQAASYFDSFRWADHLDEHDPGFGNVMVYLCASSDIDSLEKSIQAGVMPRHYQRVVDSSRERLKKAYESIGLEEGVAA